LGLVTPREFLGRGADRIGALARQALADLGRLEHADGLAGDLVEDLLRRAGGGEHALPGADLVAGVAKLGGGRDVAPVGQAALARMAPAFTCCSTAGTCAK